MNWYSKGEFEKQILAQVNSHLEGVNPSERASALFQISEKIIKLAEEYEDEDMVTYGVFIQYYDELEYFCQYSTREKAEEFAREQNNKEDVWEEYYWVVKELEVRT